MAMIGPSKRTGRPKLSGRISQSTDDPTTAQTGEADSRKVFVKSYGCQMNVYDSERMLDALAQKGFTEVADQYEADLVVLNTCHIRAKATQKVYSELGKLRILKDSRKSSDRPLNVAVAGCIAQAEGAELIRRQPTVDLVIGPQSYHKLGNLVDGLAPSSRTVETEFPIESKFDHLPQPALDRVKARGVSAFVTVQEGCDKFCTFCVVPYTRGAETSRPVAGILEEVETLASGGVREITLLGQNVNAYHGKGADGSATTLAGLLKLVGKIPGIQRLRYMTSHPRDMLDDLIELHGTDAKTMPYLHLPVQSGSDSILEQMNRKHTAQEYFEIVSKVRACRPDIALSSDFIVGFPGETHHDFQQTMDLVEKIGFASAYSFKYSPRPGTPGAGLDDDVTEIEKSRRLKELQVLLEEQRRDFNLASVGSTTEVLFEKSGRYSGQITGKTPYLQTVQVDAEPHLIGETHPVLLTEVRSNSLFGTVMPQ